MGTFFSAHTSLCAYVCSYMYVYITLMFWYTNIGIALILEGFMSSLYHICPTNANFQFGTYRTYTMFSLGLICWACTYMCACYHLSSTINNGSTMKSKHQINTATCRFCTCSVVANFICTYNVYICTPIRYSLYVCHWRSPTGETVPKSPPWHAYKCIHCLLLFCGCHFFYTVGNRKLCKSI